MCQATNGKDSEDRAGVVDGGQVRVGPIIFQWRRHTVRSPHCVPSLTVQHHYERYTLYYPVAFLHHGASVELRCKVDGSAALVQTAPARLPDAPTYSRRRLPGKAWTVEPSYTILT